MQTARIGARAMITDFGPRPKGTILRVESQIEFYPKQVWDAVDCPGPGDIRDIIFIDPKGYQGTISG